MGLKIGGLTLFYYFHCTTSFDLLFNKKINSSFFYIHKKKTIVTYLNKKSTIY